MKEITNKRSLNWNRRDETVILCRYQETHLKNPKDTRFNMQKFIAVHINNEVSEKEIKKKLHEENFLNYMNENKIK